MHCEASISRVLDCDLIISIKIVLKFAMNAMASVIPVFKHETNELRVQSVVFKRCYVIQLVELHAFWNILQSIRGLFCSSVIDSKQYKKEKHP